MKVFFIEGGIVYMGILTLLFLLIIILSVFAGIHAFSSGRGNPDTATKLLGYIKSAALFTLVFAVFSQILGLVDVFDYLANKDSGVASSILAQGIKLTFHPTMYGLIIYLTSILLTSGLKFRINRIEE
jgi:hypothetical protein